LNRRLTVSQPIGTTSWTYDAVGNVLSITDPQQNSTNYAYDNLNREISETITLPAGPASRTMKYDLDNNLTQITDRNGRVRQFVYDNLNRQTDELWLDGNGNVIRDIASHYDAAGQLTSQTDPDSAYTYTYDNLGRVLTVSNAGTPGSPMVVYANSYDAAGNLVSRSETINGQGAAVTSFTVDNLNRTRSEQLSGPGVSPARIDFGYNALDQFTTINRYADLAGTNLVVSSTFGYDAANRLTGLTHQHGSTILAAYTWGYNAANRITSRTAPDGPSAYQYDPNGELTSATTPNESYIYDQNGNRTNSSYQTGSDNRLTSDGTFGYGYDNEGNRTSRLNLNSDTSTGYTWDYRDRLVKVVSYGIDSLPVQTITFTYDVNNQRIGKQVSSNGAITRYIYVGGQVSLVFDGNQQLQERYVYGPGTDQVMAVERGVAGPVQWLLADDQGTIRDVADNTGTVIDHLVVDTFGGLISQTNASNQPRFVYAGKELDSNGLYVDGRRYYDPAVGRFLSEDPSGFAGGDTNLYRYVGNSSPNARNGGPRPERTHDRDGERAAGESKGGCADALEPQVDPPTLGRRGGGGHYEAEPMIASRSGELCRFVHTTVISTNVK
jgi:RHS repeat-associated protein